MSIIEKLGITKAPWECLINNNSVFIKTEEVLVIKTIKDPCVSDKTWNRQKRDHQLMAVAPEMLEALIELMTCDALKHMSHTIDNSKYSRLVEKATKKSWEDIKGLL